ncbi:SGNH/GDSL hydrolase family protein [Streptomyces pathocidini]|uniref:SGNH/GDSL hydrolase family protein n=1 Tax=Streptomyces pathocidini TaxID=1650571 RepID=UPI0033DF07A5
MRLSRSLTFLATAAVGGLLVSASPASAATWEENPLEIAYAALGDSYSSGVGAGSYDPGSGACKRSESAYPSLWAQANGASDFQFTACSGATTEDVLKNQLAALSENTDLVSIGIGGNDAGAIDAVAACFAGTHEQCKEIVKKSEEYVTGALPKQLKKVYDEIGERAPGADIVAVGYPYLFTGDGPGPESAAGQRMSPENQRLVNAATGLLNKVIQETAEDEGHYFADVQKAFDGHASNSQEPWIHRPTLPPEQSFHPNSQGQRLGYLPSFSAVVDDIRNGEEGEDNYGPDMTLSKMPAKVEIGGDWTTLKLRVENNSDKVLGRWAPGLVYGAQFPDGGEPIEPECDKSEVEFREGQGAWRKSEINAGYFNCAAEPGGYGITIQPGESVDYTFRVKFNEGTPAGDWWIYGLGASHTDGNALSVTEDQFFKTVARAGDPTTAPTTPPTTPPTTVPTDKPDVVAPPVSADPTPGATPPATAKPTAAPASPGKNDSLASTGSSGWKLPLMVGLGLFAGGGALIWAVRRKL